MNINDFVEQALLGKIAHLKYKKLQKFNEGNCKKNIHQSNKVDKNNKSNNKKERRFEL